MTTIHILMLCAYVFTAFWVGTWAYYDAVRNEGNSSFWGGGPEIMRFLVMMVVAPLILPQKLLTLWVKTVYRSAREEALRDQEKSNQRNQDELGR